MGGYIIQDATALQHIRQLIIDTTTTSFCCAILIFLIRIRNLVDAN